MTEPQTVDCAVYGPSFAVLGRRIVLTAIPQTPVDSLRNMALVNPRRVEFSARAGRMQVNETASSQEP